MPCVSPLDGWFSRRPGANGKPVVVFNGSEADRGSPVTVPCGQCIGCRLEYARSWAVRCMHEASMHEENCFVTLTYDDDKLPSGGSLKKKDCQDFVKRLRSRNADKRIRFCQLAFRFPSLSVYSLVFTAKSFTFCAIRCLL